MSKINCPECGFPISDNVKKCPKCKFPVGKFTSPEYFADNNNYDFTGSAIGDFGSEVTYSYIRKTMLGKKILRYGGIAIIALVVVAAAIIFLINFDTGMSNKGDILDIQELSVGRIMRLNGKYVIKITSNETRPFVSIIRDTKNGAYSYVYMEQGSGEINYEFIDDGEDNDAGESPEAVGYFSGYSVTEKNIDNVSSEYKYYDYLQRAYTACTIDYEITLKSKLNGILFYDVECDNEHTSTSNKYMVVIDGIGRGSCILNSMAYRTRDIETEFKPIYFIPATQLEKNTYKLSREFTARFTDYYDFENKYLGYNIYGEIDIPDIDEGLVLYKYSLENKENRINEEEKNGMTNIEDGSCAVNINDSVMGEDNSDLTDYCVNICAYVVWNDISSGSGKSKDIK